MPKPQQDQGDGAGGLFNFFAYLLCAPGVTFSMALTKTGEVGWRAAANPVTAVGMMISISLICLTAPPLAWAIVTALVWMAVIRHRLWPAPDFHSRSIGDCYLPLLPSAAGRFLASLTAVLFGVVMAENPGPYQCLGIWLFLAGGGQVVLHAMLDRRRSLQDADALDALADAKDRAGRLGR